MPAFRHVATLMPKAVTETQYADLPPFDARYLRVRTIAAPGQRFTALGSFHAVGRETGPVQPGDIAGCWTINGEPARFERRGARVVGVIGNDDPVHFDGGFDGRTNRLLWLARAQYGFALLTVSPDGQSISGVRWHERVGFDSIGLGWLGTRGDCATAPFGPDKVRARFLDAQRRWPLYGLRFDAADRLIPGLSAATLDEAAARLRAASQPLRVVAHEFQEPAAQQNRTRAERRLAAVREALAARGVDVKKIRFVNAAGQPDTRAQDTTVQRFFVSSIDIEK